ncbi:type IV secretory system conjugative DNA transfer family protein [Tenacibaculum agarivorans]|uniref:type IV secretory system conjugative DNA transfer family protein n=1 Tax=Tenacibaculum agarivorans TaxID=1908389 RepID=UPI0009F8D46C|nr:TraM recognition domain-containing protein [Tenacibaculum agarivorans]
MKFFEVLNSGNYKLILFTLSGVLLCFSMITIAFQIKLSKTFIVRVLLSVVVGFVLSLLGYLLFNRFVIPIGLTTYINNMFIPGTLASSFYIGYSFITKDDEELLEKRKPTRTPKLKDNNFRFTIETSGDKDLVHSDPYDNFLVVAGANSGKTKSIGRQLLREYIKFDFAGFVYDLKDFDYTRVVAYLLEKVIVDYPFTFYYMNFVDPSKSYRCNIIKPSLLKVNDIVQNLEDFARSYMGKDAKEDEWFEGGLGILKGVGVRFYYDFPQYCTLPHIAHFILQNSSGRVKTFLEGRPESKALGKAFIDTSQSTPKAAGSYLSSISGILGKFAFNKEICYVLSGDDFDFNLIDPAQPKLLCVSNSYGLKDIVSPVISMMIQMSARRFSLHNKIDFVYFLDEATTFKVKNFEEMPSVLREYKVSFTFITQSITKIEIPYTVAERRSLLSNLGNQYIGKSTESYSQKVFSEQFPKEDIIKKTKSKSANSKGGTTSGMSYTLKEEYKYEPHFFQHLRPGEFVGNAQNSNFLDFHLQFNQFLIDESYQVPTVREVNDQTLYKNFEKIIETVQNLF